MSASKWIDPTLDGTGGGFGKYRGLTILEISHRFDRVYQDPNMRSVSAILRIAYEQLEGRSHLAVSSYSAAVLGASTLILAIAYPFVPEMVKALELKACAVSSVLFVGFFAGALKSRYQAKAAFAQEKAIYSMSLDYLERIVSTPGFKSGSLDSVQEKTLQTILKKTKSSSENLALLLNR